MASASRLRETISGYDGEGSTEDVHDDLLEGRSEEGEALDRPAAVLESDVFLVEEIHDVEHVTGHVTSVATSARTRESVHIGRNGAKGGATLRRKVVVPCVGDLDRKRGVVNVLERGDEVNGVLELVLTNGDHDALRAVRRRG